MGVREELREIRRLLEELNEKVEALLEERETVGLMRLAKRSLAEFMEREPDLYSLDDLRVRYGR